MPPSGSFRSKRDGSSAEAMAYAADRIGTYASAVYEVATFYTMYNLPHREISYLCLPDISCYLLGKQEIVDYIRQELGD